MHVNSGTPKFTKFIFSRILITQPGQFCPIINNRMFMNLGKAFMHIQMHVNSRIAKLKNIEGLKILKKKLETSLNSSE